MIGKCEFQALRPELWLCFSLVLVFYVGIDETAGQEIKRVKRVNGSTLEIRDFTEIPEATEPCNPEECDWWTRLRTAGNALQRNNTAVARKKFYSLLAEGRERSYGVPIANRPPQKLAFGRWKPPVRNWATVKNGSVDLAVEVNADASVGEVAVLSGLTKTIEKLCIKEARESVYLPAVKDGAFVADRFRTERTFFAAPQVNYRIQSPF